MRTGIGGLPGHHLVGTAECVEQGDSPSVEGIIQAIHHHDAIMTYDAPSMSEEPAFVGLDACWTLLIARLRI